MLSDIAEAVPRNPWTTPICVVHRDRTEVSYASEYDGLQLLKRKDFLDLSPETVAQVASLRIDDEDLSHRDNDDVPLIGMIQD